MKLFDNYDAVMFPEENLIFITHYGYIYYIYDLKYKHWRKHHNAGNDRITIGNYQDVNEQEIRDAMSGKMPAKETDFMRLCKPSQLSIQNMLALLGEDYPNYMNDRLVYRIVHAFLKESNIRYKSYLRLNTLFNNARSIKQDKEQVIDQIKKLCFEVIGRDIFKKEIKIVDGHDPSSYFWIMPVRVIDYFDTNAVGAVAGMRHLEISIEEDDVAQYLTPFLFKYFDVALKANKRRAGSYWIDDDGNERVSFEWYLTHNFYTYDSMMHIIRDINDTIEALLSGNNNEYTAVLKEKRGTETNKLLYAKNLSEEQIDEYNANRPKEDDTEMDLIIDFYRRFVYRIEYMMKVGKENGYDLISFMGP